MLSPLPPRLLRAAHELRDRLPHPLVHQPAVRRLLFQSALHSHGCPDAAELLAETGIFTAPVVDALPTSHQEEWQTLASRIRPDQMPQLLDALCEHGPGRRQAGAYYTAPDVTRYLCESTIIPRLLAGHDLDRHLTENHDLRKLALDHIASGGKTSHLRSRLQDLTILDPTCGSGAFLRAALELLRTLYVAVGESPAESVRLALEHNLRGVDLSPAAVETARMLLALELLRYGPSANARRPRLDQVVRVGNAVVDSDADNTRPFHWSREFPEVMARGGFDVVLGNPPYISMASVRKQYQITGFQTAACESLYAPVVERALQLRKPDGRLGMIVPISAISGEGYRPLTELLLRDDCWISSFSNRPAKLFPGVEQRLAIFNTAGVTGREPRLRVTPYQHWYEHERPELFRRLGYQDASRWPVTGMPAKTGTAVADSVFRKLLAHRGRLGDWPAKGDFGVWYHDGPTYWVRALSFSPHGSPNHYHRIPVQTQEDARVLASVLSSTTFYFFFKAVSNCRDLGRKEWAEFPIDVLSAAQLQTLAGLGRHLEERLRATSRTRTRVYPSGRCDYTEYYPAQAKDILDLVDRVLAEHYGFTDEELAFVLDFELKYRLRR